MICTKCGMTIPEVELDECVGCGGALRPSAEELLRYPKFGLVKEVRPPQIQMAKLIEEALDSDVHEEVVVEGGCGVGKTFAYLAPALRSDSRIVISTGNKMLQDQLYEKDIPTLLKVMGLDNLKLFINLKGKNNYICKKRLRAQKPVFKRKKMVELWDRIVAWAEEDSVGDIKRWPGIENFDLHPLYLTRVDECDKAHCKHHAECGYYQTKQRTKDADVLLINHYLLGWDLRLKGGLIFGEYDWLIVDEAHGAPDAIRSAFSTNISQKWLPKFLDNYQANKWTCLQHGKAR